MAHVKPMLQVESDIVAFRRFEGACRLGPVLSYGSMINLEFKTIGCEILYRF